MRTIPFKDLPQYDRDLNEFEGKYMIMKGPRKHTPKPFVRVQVKNISEL